MTDSAFCDGFIRRLLQEGKSAKEVASLIAKSADLDPSIAALWDSALPKLAGITDVSTPPIPLTTSSKPIINPQTPVTSSSPLPSAPADAPVAPTPGAVKAPTPAPAAPTSAPSPTSQPSRASAAYNYAQSPQLQQEAASNARDLRAKTLGAETLQGEYKLYRDSLARGEKPNYVKPEFAQFDKSREAYNQQLIAQHTPEYMKQLGQRYHLDDATSTPEGYLKSRYPQLYDPNAKGRYELKTTIGPDGQAKHQYVPTAESVDYLNKLTGAGQEVSTPNKVMRWLGDAPTARPATSAHAYAAAQRAGADLSQSADKWTPQQQQHLLNAMGTPQGNDFQMRGQYYGGNPGGNLGQWAMSGKPLSQGIAPVAKGEAPLAGVTSALQAPATAKPLVPALADAAAPTANIVTRRLNQAREAAGHLLDPVGGVQQMVRNRLADAGYSNLSTGLAQLPFQAIRAVTGSGLTSHMARGNLLPAAGYAVPSVAAPALWNHYQNPNAPYTDQAMSLATGATQWPVTLWSMMGRPGSKALAQWSESGKDFTFDPGRGNVWNEAQKRIEAPMGLAHRYLTDPLGGTKIQNAMGGITRGLNESAKTNVGESLLPMSGARTDEQRQELGQKAQIAQSKNELWQLQAKVNSGQALSPEETARGGQLANSVAGLEHQLGQARAARHPAALQGKIDAQQSLIDEGQKALTGGKLEPEQATRVQQDIQKAQARLAQLKSNLPTPQTASSTPPGGLTTVPSVGTVAGGPGLAGLVGAQGPQQSQQALHPAAAGAGQLGMLASLPPAELEKMKGPAVQHMQQDPSFLDGIKRMGVNPQDVGAFANQVWEGLGPYRYLIAGGLSLAAISAMMGGDGTLRTLMPLLGLGAAAYGASQSPWMQKLMPSMGFRANDPNKPKPPPQPMPEIPTRRPEPPIYA